MSYQGTNRGVKTESLQLDKFFTVFTEWMLTGCLWLAADVRMCLTHHKPQTINPERSCCALLTFHLIISTSSSNSLLISNTFNYLCSTSYSTDDLLINLTTNLHTSDIMCTMGKVKDILYVCVIGEGINCRTLPRETAVVSSFLPTVNVVFLSSLF